MSRKDPKKKKERELRKRNERLAAEELEREKARNRRSMPTVLTQIEALFKTNASATITMAFEKNLSPEEIAEALKVPIGDVNYFFDIAGGLSDDLLRLVRRWPNAFENPDVFKAAVQCFESGKYKQLFRSTGL